MQQVCPSEAAGSDLRGTREWCPCENLTPDDAAGTGEAALAHPPPRPASCAARLLTGHRPIPVRGLGAGDPCCKVSDSSRVTQETTLLPSAMSLASASGVGAGCTPPSVLPAEFSDSALPTPTQHVSKPAAPPSTNIWNLVTTHCGPTHCLRALRAARGALNRHLGLSCLPETPEASPAQPVGAHPASPRASAAQRGLPGPPH